MTLLEVSSSQQGPMLVVRVSGELDVSTAPILQRELDRVAEQSPAAIRLDLSALRFMDSTGLQLVLSMASRAQQDGRGLELVRGTHSVQRVFQVAGLEERLTFVDPEGGDGSGA
ncbi:MAG: STAS domain-containing protein [Actinomycetota bacterium]